jgi:hypothetical protein
MLLVAFEVLVGFRAGARKIAGIQLPHCVEYKRAEIACKEELRPRLLLVLGAKSNASRGPPPSGLDSAECCDLPRNSAACPDRVVRWGC